MTERDQDAAALASNVSAIRDAIERAAQRVGRDPRAIRLLAATKTVPVERLRQAQAAGLTLFGENRLQEALPKIEALGRQTIEWHFIGRVQRRKVRDIVGSFRLIHSVESVELGEEIDRRAAAAGIRQAVLLEVNVGGEATKAGFSPEQLEQALPAFSRMSHVAVQGLMTIPPPQDDPERARPAFRLLRELAQRLAPSLTSGTRLGELSLRELSMGMSHDFEVAVEEGATIVRVGTGLFGPRPVREPRSA